MYTKKAMQKIASGDVLTLVFDNPSSGESIWRCARRRQRSSSSATTDVQSFIWKITEGLNHATWHRHDR
jgi:tRNA 2-thiouridine synthesizing protein A